MKKIDKLVIGSFFGPFFLTFFVVIFILLSQFMLKYLDEIVGKDLGTTVILELIFYFSIFMTPQAFPLAILLSSLMTFGNLGQHFELTAMKGAGISLIRVLVPIFVFTLTLSTAAYYSNNFIVPKANLKAFSLLYDVKQMKPSMELKEGAFYNGIDGFSIKVGKKFQDGETLKDIIIYDHTAAQGNRYVTMADSGRMYNILNDRYLVLEMFDGRTYFEQKSSRRNYAAQQTPDPLFRNEFQSQKVVFSLASFDLKRTKEELFASNRLMKNSFQLKNDIDSMRLEFIDKTEEVKENSFQFFDYHLQDLFSVYKEKAKERAERKRQEEMMEEREQEEIRRKEEAEIQAKKIEAEEAKEEALEVIETDDLVKKMEGKSLAVDRRPDSSASHMIHRIEKDSPPPVSVVKPNIQAEKRKQAALDAIARRKSAKSIKNTNRPEINARSSKNEDKLDSLKKSRTYEENIAMIDSILLTHKSRKTALSRSLTHVRYVKNNMTMRNGQLDKLKTELNKFELERYKKLSLAATILIMFFIGAPLGSIIKRGGLGIPVLISISFFILFYVISMICEKYTRTDIMDPFVAAWMANFILFPVGMFFMKQAKNDARLFDTDFYGIAFMKIKAQFIQFKSKFRKTKSLN